MRTFLYSVNLIKSCKELSGTFETAKYHEANTSHSALKF